MLFLVFYDISLFLMAYRVGYVQPCKISALIRPLYRTSPSIIPGGLVLYCSFDCLHKLHNVTNKSKVLKKSYLDLTYIVTVLESKTLDLIFGMSGMLDISRRFQVNNMNLTLVN